MFKQKTILSGLYFLVVLSLVPVTAQSQLDDPTRPPGYRLVLPGGKTATSKIHYLLSSVRISATRRSAVVNDRSVETGDIVNGAKILAIYPSVVKLKKLGKTFNIRLVSDVVKKTKVH